MIEGKLPPQDLAIEEVVLGTLLLDSDAYSRIADIISPETFYKETHSIVFSAIVELRKSNLPVDLRTVTNQLRKSGNLDGVGGAVFIAGLTNSVASTANLEAHAHILNDKYIRRQIIIIGNQTANAGYDDSIDSEELLTNLNAKIQMLSQSTHKESTEHISDITPLATKDIEKRMTNEFGTSGYAKGIQDVDRILGGYQKTDLIYIAGRPGMGKSADMVSDALRMAKRGVPVAIFSLEMGKVQLVMRFAAQISGVDVEILVKQKVEGDRLNNYYQAVDVLNSLPIYIDDTPSLSVYAARTKITRLVKKKGVEIVFIDYVQLMSLGLSESKKMHGNREQEISTISRTLKLIAKENDIPVVALAQLSRQVETRGGAKKPILSDLRESGSLEQDADVIAFIYRPEYYDIEQTDEGESTRGLGDFIVAKHRNGSLGVGKMRFIHYLAHYTDFDQNWSPRPDHIDHPDTRLEPNKAFLPEEQAPF